MVDNDFPCAHPEGMPCKPTADGRCGTDVSYAKWIEQSATTEKAGTGTFVTENPDIVGDVDMTHPDLKHRLGVTGNSEVVPLPDELQNLNDVPDVDHSALEFWRKRSAAPEDDDVQDD